MNNKLSVLICDDTNENIETLIPVLEDSYELYLANTAEAALAIVEHARPDIILLDILMPGMDGYELCKIIKSKEIFEQTPVIFISGMDDIDNKQKGFDVGAVDYITKPFNIREVKARVKAQKEIVLSYRKHRDKAFFLQGIVRSKESELALAYNNLEEAYIETIARLSIAAEYKDDTTGFHVKRVGVISAEIARALELDDLFVDSIFHAAPLHDIGKMGIADHILLKPGKLTVDEWHIMKTHAEIGKKILENSRSEIIQMAEVIAYTHHEKWLGEGYPLGLLKEEIPIESRIVALADVYDAVTSKRSYKEAFPKERAMEIIIEGRGNHFDPEVVDAFMSVIEKIEKKTRFLHERR